MCSCASTEPESGRDMCSTDMLLGRGTRFKAGPGFDFFLGTLPARCDRGEASGSLYGVGEIGSVAPKGWRGEMGGLALGDVAAGDRIRWASFGFQGIGSGSGADSALEWGRTRSWVCWKGSSFGVIGSRLPREVRGASWLCWIKAICWGAGKLYGWEARRMYGGGCTGLSTGGAPRGWWWAEWRLLSLCVIGSVDEA